MNALSSRLGRNRLQGLLAVVVALSIVAGGVSTARASDLTSATASQLTLAQADVLSVCEVQLAGLRPRIQSAIAPLAGLALLRNDVSGFDLWRPAGWTASAVAFPYPVFGRQVIYLGPGAQNGEAHLTIETRDLGAERGGADLVDLITNFDGAIHALPNSQVESQWHSWSGNVLTFDGWYTYHYGDTWRKVWTRWLYAGTRQYILTAEAPSSAEFDRLQQSFFAMMITFRPDGQLDQQALPECGT